MKTLLKYGALLAAAAVLLPIDGFAQGHGRGGGGDQLHARDRAQVERGQREHDRDRMHDRDRIHQSMRDPAHDMMRSQERQHAQEREQMRQQKQIHVPGTGTGPDADIYGHEMMTVQERNRYREQMQLVQSDPEKKARFLAQHREQMQARAKAQGMVIDDAGKTE